MYCRCTKDTLHEDPDLTQQEFYCILAEDLIENNIQKRRGTRRSQNNPQNIGPISSETVNLIPELRVTRAKKRYRNGTMTKFYKTPPVSVYNPSKIQSNLKLLSIILLL